MHLWQLRHGKAVLPWDALDWFAMTSLLPGLGGSFEMTMARDGRRMGVDEAVTECRISVALRRWHVGVERCQMV